jgi:glycine cleavage system transcriptional repressor
MRIDIVFTLTGPDRVGVVEEVTRVMFDLGGNVGTSRMARLGGEFAVIMLAAIPADRLVDLDRALERFAADGYAVTARQAQPESVGEHSGWLPFHIEVLGADHEGIVHEIARDLSDLGITIESAETQTTEAAVSAVPLFSMTAMVLVPPTLAEAEWRGRLERAAARANVDVTAVAADRR